MNRSISVGTGDVLRRDADGWLFFHDRSVDVIKHKVYRVAASKIDNALHEHPAVIASCTIGMPDDVVGGAYQIVGGRAG